MPDIRLITIDLDDTLWPCRPTIDAAEQAFFAWLEDRTPRITADYDMAALRLHRIGLRREREDIAHDLTALRLESLRSLLADYGYSNELAEPALMHFLEHRNRVRPYAEVAVALRKLGRDYLLVALTNGNADVERTPLRGLFHRAYQAEQVGAAKPDPALFQAALDWAGLASHQALHLGDDPSLDVEAARRHGMRAVWVNRFELAWPETLPPPEAEIVDLSQLWERFSLEFKP